MPAEAPERGFGRAVTRLLPVICFALILAVKQVWLVSALGMHRGPYLVGITALTSCALAAWVATLPSRFQWVAMLAMDLTLSLLFALDSTYARVFGELPAAARLKDLWELGLVSDAAAQTVVGHDLAFFTDVPVVALAWWATRGHLSLLRLRSRWAVGATVAAATASLAITTSRLGDYMRMSRQVGLRIDFNNLSPVIDHGWDLATYLWRQVLVQPPSAREQQDLVATLKARAARQGPAGELFGAAAGMNVIFLQVESLMNFPMSEAGPGPVMAPNLAKLAHESLVFDDFFSQAGVATTADAELLVYASLYPLRDTAVFNAFGTRSFHGIPEVAREHGYHTIALLPERKDFWSRGTVYPRLGISEIHGNNEWDLSDRIGLGISDESFVRQLAPRAKSLPEPFFLVTHTLTSHDPFSGFRRNPDGSTRTMLESYVAAIEYADGAIGHLLALLRANGVLDRSILVVYGDHTPLSMRGDPNLSRLLGVPIQDESAWFELDRHVPMMIRFPAGAHAGHVRRPTGEIDIGPTVLGLLGISEDVPTSLGQDALRSSGPTHEIFPDGSAVDEHHIFVAASTTSDATCFDRARRAPLSLPECDELRTAAASDLALSSRMIEKDLLRGLQISSGRDALAHQR